MPTVPGKPTASASEKPPDPPILESSSVVPSSDLDAHLAIEDIPQIEEDSTLERQNRFLFAVGGVGALGIVVASITLFLLYIKNPPTQKKVIVQSPPVSSIKPTPSYKREDITFEVQNGSGIPGKAGKAASVLVGEGYTVIKIGNALSLTSASVVWTSSALTLYQTQQLLSDLTRDFGVASVAGALTDSTASARLVVGK